MSKNVKLNNYLIHPPAYVMHFGKALSTISTQMRSVGSLLTDGASVPYKGVIYKISAWDETTRREKVDLIYVNEHDRLQIQADYIPGTTDFTLTLNINGQPTALVIESIARNQNCFVIIYFGL